MKKNVILLLFSLNVFASYSQTNWVQDSIVQKKNYQFAVDHFEKNDTINGIRSLYSTYKYGENTELGIKVKKELDSFIEIKRVELLRNIKGKWKLKKAGSNWGFSEVDKSLEYESILIIDSDSITFYKKDKNTKVLEKLKSEKINFTEICYKCEESMFYFHFSDNQVWIFEPKKKNTILHLKNDGYFHENGNRTKISCGNSEMSFEKIN